VWEATNVANADILHGPPDDKGFSFDETVTCDYSPKTKYNGLSPKFPCAINGDDVVKVKYGRDNGEVFAEVAATRLLWALGFGADHMYPVRVICHGCSKDPLTDRGWHEGTVAFDPASIERRFPGKELESHGITGWKWPELDLVSAEAGGAPIEQRDALKLIAVMLQHTDSKAEQQRLLCLDDHAKREPAAECEHPFMMLNDVGITFGRANLQNDKDPGSVNLDAWSHTHVFTTDKGPCTGNIAKSFSGTLEYPHISEEGRKFLSGLLAQLSDGQLRDLFTVARFPARMSPEKLSSGTVDQWVDAFKAKRAEIASRTCS